MIRLFCALGIVVCILAACNGVETPTVESTPTLSGPTLAPSPTIHIRTSDDLYGDGQSGIGQNNLTAAALPNVGGMPPILSGTREPGTGAEVVQVVADDGQMLEARLYQRDGGRRPGVLLLAASGVSWGTLPQDLLSNNFTVMAMDLRPAAGTSDVFVTLLALSELATVNSSQLAVIGAAQGADLAILGCVTSRIPDLCDMTVVLSPLSRDTLLNVMPDYNPRPLMVVAARDDVEAYPAALALAQAATGPSTFLEYDTGQGAALLTLNPGLSSEIANWLLANLPQTP